ncbi:MAG TPA: DUF6152 family protein [Rhodanobacteraceae bacterium]|nr:DUF6152 family protein [Rhodanobacteraceae bacterium]
MLTYTRVAVAAALTIVFCPALAHHSNSAYQVDKIVTLEGTVKEWKWMNPHTWLILEVDGADGKKQEWAVEGRPPGILGRAGWSGDILQPGERVTVHASPAKNGDPEGIIARVTKADGTVLGNQPNFNRAAAAEVARPAAPSATPAAGSRPNFAGVYYPAQEGGQAPPPARRPGEPLPPPTRSSPTADGSQGRSPEAPKLTPEYLAKWNEVAKSRISGSYATDNVANCLPPGVPAMMSAAYGMEIMQDEQKITFFSEHQDALRRVYLDGRKPTPEILADPTYAGYSTGRWEGDTLVVDTVALTTKSYIDGASPHSDKMTVHERMRIVEPGVIENQITVNDPEALTEPWRTTRRYRKASYPNDQLREFACAEGLRDAPVHQAR